MYQTSSCYIIIICIILYYYVITSYVRRRKAVQRVHIGTVGAAHSLELRPVAVGRQQPTDPSTPPRCACQSRTQAAALGHPRGCASPGYGRQASGPVPRPAPTPHAHGRRRHSHHLYLNRLAPAALGGSPTSRRTYGGQALWLLLLPGTDKKQPTCRHSPSARRTGTRDATPDGVIGVTMSTSLPAAAAAGSPPPPPAAAPGDASSPSALGSGLNTERKAGAAPSLGECRMPSESNARPATAHTWVCTHK